MQKNTKQKHQSRKHTPNRQGKPHDKGPRKDHRRDQQGEPPAKGPRTNLYGFHAVREAWLNETRTVEALYVTEQGLASFEPVLREARGLQRPSPIMIDKKQLERMLPQGAVHQGLALAAGQAEEFSVKDFIIRAESAGKSLIVMLDQVTDPHNVGAILRSACVFGLDGMVMQRKHAPELDGVLAKTACGAVEHVPVAYETNLSRALEELKEGGFFVYGLDERGESLNALKDLPDKMVVIMGAEGPGLRRLIKENCDVLVRLPTSGPISSLNVSNAAAVTFYALTS